MVRRSLICMVLLAPLAAPGKAEDAARQRALALHRDIIAIDAHVDIPPEFMTETANPAVESAMQFDLPKLERGGLAGAVLAVFVPQTARTPENYRTAQEQGLQKLEAIRAMTTRHADRVALARSTEEIRRLHAQQKPFVVVGMLNGYSLGARAEYLQRYYDAGLRQLGFNHAGHNDLADSSRPQTAAGDQAEEHKGLSALGRDTIARMNRLGIIVDVSQLTPAGVRQAVEVSRTPVIASHSGMRSRVDHPRNLSDDEMRLIADRGGVVHVVAFGGYLIEMPFSFSDRLEALRAKFDARDEKAVAALPEADRKAYRAEFSALLRALPPVGLSEYVDTIDAAVKLIGIDHVGISSDFNHGGRIDGYTHVGEAYNITAELLRRGYRESDIAKLWGENWLRVLADVERAASR